MIISATPRQSIRFGKQDARQQDDPARQLAEDLVMELKAAEQPQDALVLSRKADSSEGTLQSPASRHYHGKVVHELHPEQFRALQMVLSSWAASHTHQAGTIREIRDERIAQNEKRDDQEKERVNINVVNASGKAKTKKSESKDGLTLNIYNNLTQNNTQNAAQSGGLWNTLTSAAGLNSPMGIVKMVAATGAAGLGAYYLGPKVMGYAKNKFVNAVIPENLVTQAKDMVSVPLSWFSKNTVAAAANATETAASTATRTVSEAVGATTSATLSNAGSMMDNLGHTADFVGNMASKGWNVLNYIKMPLLFWAGETIYQSTKRLTPAGRMTVHHHHHHHAVPVQDFGREIVKKGNVHSFK